MNVKRNCVSIAQVVNIEHQNAKVIDHAKYVRENITLQCDKSSILMMVIHPVVVVKVNNIMCRALLDTGAGSSYASDALLD